MIEVHNLKKQFGKSVVLKGINASFEQSKVTAVVGPNGSGKTTLIKSILGLINPSDGIIKVDETDIKGDFFYRNKIGYMPQIARYPENLTANELMDLVNDLRNSEPVFADEIKNSFRLDSEMQKAFKNLSGGTKQKISALIAFSFNPQILILDEPTAGLDPISSSYFKDLVLREKQNKKTIILTSHIMSEIQELADNIIFILEGEIKFNGSIESLLQHKNETKLERAIAELMSKDQ